ncbi:MAG TPA: NADPH-dependent 7-cyano-7-deazaguanine reductase QueF [Firmicutes bacterium]|jgi:7-cyano-7-deazaguanine reductase|nr:NADPH-dependent 7-cyano-7-deazaguanine reductase QueF [Bacillota bacterium]
MKDKEQERKHPVLLKPEQVDRGVLETVPFAYAGRRSEVEIVFPEFTSVCPWTGLPDFGVLRIIYVPRETCVELKSLKYYLNSYRQVGIIQEDVVNRILDDLVKLTEPLSMTVAAEFNPRGGMKTLVSTSFPQ